MKTFEEELEELINKYCLENESNTPDFILARYLVECLNLFNAISKAKAVFLKGSE